MPLLDEHQIVSVDDHLVEHPRVWQDRLPAAMREAGPRIVEMDGMHIWNYDGDMFPTIGLNAVAGKPPEEWGMDPVRYEDMIPGCYDPTARVADMDLDGVQAALCFPSFPGFAGGTFHRAKDKDLALLCVKAWNDFYIDEWCATAPDRYIPLAILPTWDIDAAVEEAKRVADKVRGPSPSRIARFHWGCRRFTLIIGIGCGRSVRTRTSRCRCTSGRDPTSQVFRFRRPSRSRVRWSRLTHRSRWRPHCSPPI